MTWLKQEQASRHRCPVPSREESHNGDVWLCDECGRLWRHAWDDVDRYWSWALPPTRWKYRAEVREWREGHR